MPKRLRYTLYSKMYEQRAIILAEIVAAQIPSFMHNYMSRLFIYESFKEKCFENYRSCVHKIASTDKQTDRQVESSIIPFITRNKGMIRQL